MKKLLTFTLLLVATCVYSQKAFRYNGEEILTGKHTIYVNPKIKSKPKAYIYNNVNDALRCAEKLQQKRIANDTTWTCIYIEPSVYWIDNPNDTTIHTALPGDHIPYGMKLQLSKTKLIGMGSTPDDVVLAAQRGQTQGAIGNFTMFHITGDDFHAENLTFGNYCNVDLNYTRDPKLSRKKKSDAIVQAQLIICNGTRYTATNCNFISRLNLCPYAGAKDATFNNCYFECTDDALCGTGKYVSCRFTLFSSKPFYTTSRKGAYFYDCDIYTKTKGTQYLTKVSGPVTLEKCRWISDDKNLIIKWAPKPNPKDKCYMIDCTLNGKKLDVPTTPDIPMPVGLSLMPINNILDIHEGKWTLDVFCPSDLGVHKYETDINQPAWGYGEGVDGAEGTYGLIQRTRGARMMYTGISSEDYDKQKLVLSLNPCKGPGQGFGSATGQYMDICIKFDTRTLTGYGIRFIRTVNYDRAVEVMLVKYNNGEITQITEPQKCTIFRRGCQLTLSYADSLIKAEIQNGDETQSLSAKADHNKYGGIHIQHTGSTGASATVISGLKCEYGK